MKKQYTYSEMHLILIRNGYVIVGQSGSHIKYVKVGVVQHIIIKRDMCSVIFWRLIKENDLNINVLDNRYWKKIKKDK